MNLTRISQEFLCKAKVVVKFVGKVISSAANATDVRLYGLKDIKGLRGRPQARPRGTVFGRD